MDYAELGRQFGLNEAQTRAAFEQLAPVVAAGIRRNNQSDGGLEGLLKALQGGDHRRYADDPSELQFDRVADDGNAILGHVFGSKDVSRGVANQAADLSGVGSAILKKMLPVIAAIIMGQLAKKMGAAERPGLRKAVRAAASATYWAISSAAAGRARQHRRPKAGRRASGHSRRHIGRWPGARRRTGRREHKRNAAAATALGQHRRSAARDDGRRSGGRHQS